MKDRILLRRLIFSIVLGLLGYYFHCASLLHQLQEPHLVFPDADNFYWLMLFSGVPELIVSNEAYALGFDIALIGVIVLNIFFHRSWLTVLYLIGIVLYIVTLNNYINFHNHAINALFFIGLPFIFKDSRRFVLTWRAVRYYTLFIMVSAFLWKLGRGSIFYPHQMAEVLKEKHALHFAVNAAPIRSPIWSHLIGHPFIAQIGYIGVALLEAAFIVGFFSRRWDWLLFCFFWAFIIGVWVIMDIDFLEFAVLSFTLLPRFSFSISEPRD